jgi:hypothetical protein
MIKKSAAITKKDEAKGLILREWDEWVPKHVPPTRKPTGMDAMSFFNYLQKECSPLLKFQARGDLWQIVHGWLLQEKRVDD